MTPTSSILLLFLWTAACHAIALYIFMSGFLLTRQALDIKSKPLTTPWQHFPITNQTRSHLAEALGASPPTSASLTTLLRASSFSRPNQLHPTSHPHPFRKLVVILIDALRFDFVLTHPPSNPFPIPYYHNNFPLIEQLRQENPSRSLLFQYRADPPTTTTQRLKAILTGSLPTFIDAGSSFASSAVSEDHLLRHLHDKTSNIYFMGDDTWTHLYPEVFSDKTRTFPYESFKTFDLHTVDTGVQSHLLPLLSASSAHNSTWDVLIAHFLGVDHCGHKFGPSNQRMRDKLREMNSVLERIVAVIDDDTLLVVMGDHGMTTEGDHGGESEEELMSALWLYSTRDLTIGDTGPETIDERRYWRDLHSRVHASRVRALGYDHSAITSHLGYDAASPLYPIVSQIQLVPTLSYLLDLPIPFGNLGAVIPDVVYARYSGSSSSGGVARIANLFHLVETVRVNALQVHTYLLEYAAAGENSHGFSRAQLEPMFESLYQAEREAGRLAGTGMFEIWASGGRLHEEQESHIIETLENIFFLYDAFLLRTLKHCQYHWAQFDVGCMISGVALLALSVAAGVSLLYDGGSEDRSNWVLRRARNGAVVGFVAGLVVASVTARMVMVEGWFEKMDAVGWIGVGVAGGSSVGVMSGWAKEWVATPIATVRGGITKKSWKFMNHVPLHITLVALLSHALTLASNSYILFEDRVVRFAVASVVSYLAVFTAGAAGVHRAAMPAFVILIYARITALTGVCREEQYPYCSYITNNDLRLWDTEGSEVVMVTWAIVVGMVGMVWAMPRYMRKRIGIMGGASGFFDVYTVLLALLVARWVWILWFNSLAPPSAGTVPLNDEGQREADVLTTWGFHMASEVFEIYVPRMVYMGGIALGIVGICGWGGVVARSSERVVNGVGDEVSIEGKAREAKPLNGVDVPMDIPAQGDTLARLRPMFWTTLLSISLLIATVQRPLGGPLVVTFPAVLTQIVQLSSPGSIRTLPAQLVLFHFLGHHLFFTTGHQAIFPAIPWDAAFVGLRDVHHYIGGCLVFAATFAGWIISWAGWGVVVAEAAREHKAAGKERTLVLNNGNAKVVTEEKIDPLRPLMAATRLLTLAHTLPAFFGALFITILRRHLMTWKIFAPRFLLQCLLLVGVDAAAIAMWCVVSLIAARWGRGRESIKVK